MIQPVARKLNFSRRLLLSTLFTLAASLMFGLIETPQIWAQSTAENTAKDITGTWQGTLHAGKDLRTVLKISKEDGRLKAVMYSIDQGAQPINASSVTLDGSTFKYSVDLINGSYEGKLSPDGSSITGTWSQGSTPLPLNFERANSQNAWDIPEPPKPLPPMAADADPSFEVATIKPNDSGHPSIEGLTLRGRNFATRNSSFLDLISFAYDLQSSQIIGAPDWTSKDRYDIAAVPDQPGVPNPQQLKMMIRKLLTDRFKLKFHDEKRDLSAFVLTVAKDGSKLKATQLNGPLPGLGFIPGKGGITLLVRNGSMTDFTNFLQMLVLDRPVVNQTSLTGKYDFNVTFAPDDSEFNGHPPQFPKQADDVDAAPRLFDAIQAQLGLKLDAKKAGVDVMVIDHVDKPSAN